MLRCFHPKLRVACFAPQAPLLATAGGDGVIRLWDVALGELSWSFEVGDRVEALAFSSDGQQLTAGTHAGELITWTVVERFVVRREMLSFAVTGLLVHAQHGVFVGVSAAHGAETSLLHLGESGAHKVLAHRCPGGGNWALAASADGGLLAALCVDGHWQEFAGFWLIQLPSGRTLHERITGTLHYGGSVTFAPNGTLAVTPDLWSEGCCEGGRVFLPERPLDGTHADANTVAFHPDGRLLGRSWRHITVSAKRGLPDAHIPIGAEGPEINFLLVSPCGYVATNIDEDQFVVLSLDELDALACGAAERQKQHGPAS